MKHCGRLLNTRNCHSETEQNYLTLGSGCSLISEDWENTALTLSQSQTDVSLDRDRFIPGVAPLTSTRDTALNLTCNEGVSLKLGPYEKICTEGH